MNKSVLVRLSPNDFEAVLFDLDGVLTRTADVHAAAWKQLFDEFLIEYGRQHDVGVDPFDVQVDYRRYVDGKPRLDGVRSFLESRDIHLPPGNAEEPPPTIRSLGERKDAFFLAHLESHGIETFEPAVALVRDLRNRGIRTAVVSSSRNCAAALEAAGIAHLFDTRVDGNDVEHQGLAGKPAPDTFLEAALRLGVDASRAIVVEDAIAGVEAGRAGGFALVVGVDSGGQSQALRRAGADVVVASLDEVAVAADAPSAWSLDFAAYDPATEGVREALCTLGNGYFATRAAFPWSHPDDVHYPGCYLAGGYNRLRTEVAGRVVENEDLVNLPNWLELDFRIEGEDWFDERRVSLISFQQSLDLRRALLSRHFVFSDGSGRRTRVEERRFVSMADVHLAGLELRLTAENWSGGVRVRTGIDGRVVNSGARLYEPFDNRHLQPMAARVLDAQTVLLQVQTNQSKLIVAQAARTSAMVDGRPVGADRHTVDEEGYIGQLLDAELAQGQTLVLEKLLALYSSRDPATSEPAVQAEKAITRAPDFTALLARHELDWKLLWRRFDVHLRPADGFALNVPMLLRLNVLHLLQAASMNSIGRDVGVPARGWTGEAYQGHVFWDELFIFPTLTLRSPEISRSLLMYRFRRLDEARAAAQRAGYAGAMFPWQSGSDGQEETQELNLNPLSGRWVPDNSWRQRHVGSAVAWNVWHYWQVTGDYEFLQFYGAELILEIARFWSSISVFEEARGRYEIHGVMGPDEFHEGYPDEPVAGLRNNAYTNVMAVWVLLRAADALECLPPIRRREIETRLGIDAAERARWDDITRRMFVPIQQDGIISQFEGWEMLEELDWDDYRRRYRNIQRLDLILEAEGDNADRYKVSKQPDVLMLFYLFSSEELGALLRRLGYDFEYETIPRNVAYYDARSSLGSTLSRVVHAWVLARSDRAKSLTYFADALQSDVNDIQQGTTAEGIHLGAMAGTVDLIQRVATGIEVSADALRFNPQLPRELSRLELRIHYRGHWLDVRLTADTLTLRCWQSAAGPFRVLVGDEAFEVTAHSVRTFPLQAGSS